MKVNQHRAAAAAAPTTGPRPPSTPTTPARVVTDEQIAALVAAATQLRRRQLERLPHVAPGAEQRRARLDWAVRAGQAALASRARDRAAGTERTDAGR